MHSRGRRRGRAIAFVLLGAAVFVLVLVGRLPPSGNRARSTSRTDGVGTRWGGSPEPVIGSGREADTPVANDVVAAEPVEEITRSYGKSSWEYLPSDDAGRGAKH